MAPVTEHEEMEMTEEEITAFRQKLRFQLSLPLLHNHSLCCYRSDPSMPPCDSQQRRTQVQTCAQARQEGLRAATYATARRAGCSAIALVHGSLE